MLAAHKHLQLWFKDSQSHLLASVSTAWSKEAQAKINAKANKQIQQSLVIVCGMQLLVCNIVIVACVTCWSLISVWVEVRRAEEMDKSVKNNSQRANEFQRLIWYVLYGLIDPLVIVLSGEALQVSR